MSPLRFLPAFVLALVAIPALGHAQQSPRSQPESPWRPPSRVDSFFGLHTLLRSVADTTVSRAAPSSCPMPVARPDTSRLERMPRARVDSARMAPMPVAHGCVADAK